MKTLLRRFSLATILIIFILSAGGSTLVHSEEPEVNETIIEQVSKEVSSENYSGFPELNQSNQSDIGWEDGYTYDSNLAITNRDGLNQSELDAVVSRAMARVEHIRGESFSERVTVTIQTRAEYRNSSPFGSSNETYNKWNNQVWEALFIVDSQTDIAVEMKKYYQGGVNGYYSSETDELVIISSNSSRVQFSESVLIHELTHALQDQRFDLTQPSYNPSTQDGQLGTNGLIEGEAKYVESQYQKQCRDNWSCLDEPSRTTTTQDINRGIQFISYQPYVHGPRYVRHIVETGGWQLVDEKFRSPPLNSHLIIHPNTTYPDSTIQQPAQHLNGWSTFETVGNNGSDSVGEASLFVMLWYQNVEYNINTIPRGSITDSTGNLTYNHSLSSGLIGDKLTPYKKNSKRGYIWQLHWKTPQDATQFRQAYERILTGHGGTQLSNSTWRISSSGYADTFHVTQSDDTLIITNAPTTTGIQELQPTENISQQTDSGFKFTIPTDTSSLVTIVLTISGLVYLFWKLLNG